MTNKAGKGFLLTTKFYKSANNAAFRRLRSGSHNPEGKACIQPKGMDVKKQENTTTKQIVTQKFYANDLHVKLGHPSEDRMRVIIKYLHYIIKDTLDICEECATEKSNRNSYKKWRRSATSSRAKSSILILSHKRNQVMEVLRIGFSYKTVTQNKNGISSQRQKNIYLKKLPLS